MIDLENIFKKRIGGATNIIGVDYQIIYSLWKALDMYESNTSFTSIQLEGFEDVDIKRINRNQQIFIQVKTSKNKWHWNLLKKEGVLKNFAEIYEPGVQLELIIGATVSNEVLKINAYKQLPQVDRKKFEKEFIKIFRDSTTQPFSDDQILDMLAAIVVHNLDRETLVGELKRKLNHQFDIHSAALLEFYLRTFAYRFVEWAKVRKEITKIDLDQLYITIQEGWVRHQQFESFGKGLITKIDWTTDNKPNDFLEGKKTRFGHIVDNLDIKREIWLNKIHKAFLANPICVIKSSSGQGKSTLAFRYIFEHWQPKFSYSIRCIQTREQALEISNYIGYLADLGLPIKLLIDDVNDDLREFQVILGVCAAKKIDTLLTIRIEDDARLNHIGLTEYEVVIPTLNLHEAKEIFNQLKAKNRIYKAQHPERAFEAIGEKGLLIEYIYLLSEGRMLHEKLKDQIQDMRHRQEVVKIQLLRQIITADTLHTPLNSQTFLDSMPNPMQHDYQGIIQELIGEFIEIDAHDQIRGLHPIRSHRLAEILHENYSNIARTATDIIAHVPLHYLASFIKNAIVHQSLDIPYFLTKIREKYFTRLESINDWHYQILQGIFEGGEFLFFIKNKAIFDEAYQLGGGDTFFFTAQLAPIHPIDPIGQIIDLLPNEHFIKLKALLPCLDTTVRGLAFVRIFLQAIPNHHFSAPLTPIIICKLIDWFALCKLEMPNWSNLLLSLTHFNQFEHYSIEDFCILSQGFYRYDSSNHKNWFTKNQVNIITYLKKILNCSSIKIVNNECQMQYNAQDEISDANKATMNRLYYLRSAIPFCDVYHGNNLFLESLSLEYNPSKKQIRKAIMPYKSDVFKNNILSDITDKEYNPKTWHEFQQIFYDLREDLIRLLDISSQQLKSELNGKRFDFKAAKKDKPLIFLELMQKLPYKTPTLINTTLEEQFNVAKACFMSIQACFLELNKIPAGKIRDVNVALLRYNYNDFLAKIPIMQAFFNKIQEISFKYYDFNLLNNQESRMTKGFRHHLEHLGQILESIPK
ncbi:MAG: hypothetical protein RLZZ628_254 [Bacteroidota bacterium]|jgi:hypothetical protein